LIRGSKDVGVSLLMDQRFASPRYTNLYPRHWQHFRRIYRPEQLSPAIENFWHQEVPQ